ncbi:transmembrane helix containing protein [Aeromonas phage vB_AspA_Tola]|nr:transmembrane helix containing protein [Aeromonas phage vB_AspA_Tola]
MNKLLAVLAGVLWLMQRHYKAKEIEDAQKSADAASSNPTGWFKSHFGGVPSTSAGYADAASKADADKRQ